MRRGAACAGRSRRRDMAAVSEISLQQADGSPLGFRLTGGSQFSMPLTVFEVSDGGRAHRAGLRPGDVLLCINGADTAGLSLNDAHRIITAAGDNVKLSISNLDDQELTENEELVKASVLSASAGVDDVTSRSSDQESSEVEGDVDHEDISQLQEDIETNDLVVTITRNGEIRFEQTSEKRENRINLHHNTAVTETVRIQKKGNSENPHSDNSDVSLKVSNTEIIACPKPMATSQEQFEEEQYVDVRSLPLRPPQPAPKPEKAQRRCWHPVMWETALSPEPEAEEELPSEEARRREYPHKQRIRNLRRLMAEGKVKAEPETLIFFLCNKFAVSDERKNKMSV